MEIKSFTTILLNQIKQIYLRVIVLIIEQDWVKKI
jgi:hypothetical protein